MPVFIIDKLKPKNNGTFKLMDTLDINHKGYDLESFINSLEIKLNDAINNMSTEARVVEMDVVDNWICWKYTTENDTQWRQIFDLSVVSGGSEPVTTSSEIYVGSTEPVDQNVKMWIDTSSEEDDNGVIEIPTKLSELENNMGYISTNNLISNLSLQKSEDDKQIVLKYGETIISTINI